MKLLVDTHSFLWSLSQPERLNARAASCFDELREPLYLSAASSWEIAIKVALGKLTLPRPPEAFVPSRMAEIGLRPLPVEHGHALFVSSLPRHHADPFDRMLVAQATLERMAILTADPVFLLYDVETLWAGIEPPPKLRRRR